MDVNSKGAQLDDENRLVQGKVLRDVGSMVFSQADLGEGNASAVLVRDNVCLAASCVDLAILAAVRLDDVPFAAMPHDGIVGLGLEGLSVSPMASFLGRLAEGSHGILPHFGISFGADSGEIYFGGHNPSRISQPIQWFPVDHPEDGFWQVAIQAVRVGNKTIDDCLAGCHGIVDTGASRLGVQASNLQKLKAAVSMTSMVDGGCQGPDLTFDLGAIALTLHPADYTDKTCAPQMGSLNLEEPEFKGVYAFGETVLRRYYAAFDWDTKRIGFAPNAVDETLQVVSDGAVSHAAQEQVFNKIFV